MSIRFEEIVKGDDGAIGAFCRVEADDYFISIITDEYEGVAQFHVSVAKQLIQVLIRAIEHVEKSSKLYTNDQD